MPKVVDHNERRREIGLAVLHLVASDGLERLTVRKIAAESGWSTGVLAHYVQDKDELIGLAVEAMAERYVARLRAIPWDDPDEALREALRQLLPLDTERQVEATAWFRLATYRPDAQPVVAIRHAHRELRALITHLLEQSDPYGHRRAAELAGELVALADGLAAHHLADPHGVPRTRIAATLDARLAELQELRARG